MVYKEEPESGTTESIVLGTSIKSGRSSFGLPNHLLLALSTRSVDRAWILGTALSLPEREARIIALKFITMLKTTMKTFKTIALSTVCP